MSQNEQNQQDIYDQLVQAARVEGRWARMLPDKPTEAQLTAAAEFIKDWMGKKKFSMNDLAKKSGMARSTISQVLSGKYPGNRSTWLRELLDLIDHEAKVDDVARPDSLVETHAVELMLALIQNVHVARTIGVIIAPAGFSKTTVLQAKHQMTKGSILVEIDEKNRNANGLIRLITEAMGLNLSRGVGAMFSEIKRTLRGSGRLLMIDQAHDMLPDAFNIVRTINDLKVGVVLAGTHILRDRVNDMKSGSQFYSRVMATLPLDKMLVMGDGEKGGPAHSVTDIIRICEAGKLRFTADARDFLFRLGNHPGLGALRQCQLLVMVVAQAGRGVDEPISRALLNAALRDLQGEAYQKFTEGLINGMRLPKVASV